MIGSPPLSLSRVVQVLLPQVPLVSTRDHDAIWTEKIKNK